MNLFEFMSGNPILTVIILYIVCITIESCCSMYKERKTEEEKDIEQNSRQD